MPAEPKLGHLTLHLSSGTSETLLTTEQDYTTARDAMNAGEPVHLQKYGLNGMPLSSFDAAPGAVTAMEFRA